MSRAHVSFLWVLYLLYLLEPNPLTAYRVASRNPQLPLDLLQECTNLIEQLHSWGMTADYMLGQGLNKDLVLKIFVEKGLKLPPHHLNSYLSRQNERAAAAATVAAASSPSVSTILPVSSDVRIPPDSSSMISTEPVLRMGSIIPVPVPVSAPAFQTQHLTHTLPRTPQQAVRQISVPLATSLIDLSEKEAKAREALLARKAEVNRRNAEKAQTFMNAQLSNLLVGKPEPGAEGMSGTNGTLEGEDIEMHALVDLKRGSLDNTFSEQLDFTNHVSEAKIQETREKLVTLEDDASQIVCKIPSSDHDTQEAAGDDLSTIRLDENSSTSYRRPVAFDFESEPTQALPNVPRWSAHLATSSRAREFVIELSDHEDSEDDSDTEELRAAVSETKQQDHPSSGSSFTSLSRAPPNGIRKQVSPSSENPQVSSLSDQGSLASSSLDTRGQLEAKQAEIKKMMDMINRLEGKKKIGHKSGSRAGTPLTPATLRDTSLFDATELSPAPQSAQVVSDISTPVAATALRHAKAAVGRLLEERRELVEEAIRVEKDDENADFMDPIDIPVNMQAQQDAAVAQLQEAATEDREKLLSTGTAGFENDNSRLGSKEALIDQAYTSSRPDGETPFGSALQISGRPEGPKSRQEFLEVEETLTNDGLSDMQDDKDTDIDEELISANGRS